MDGRKSEPVPLPEEVLETLRRLGHNIRTARQRRRLRIVDVAERVGVSRFVIADIERGKPTTSIGSYLGVLWVLGLLDAASALADPMRDQEGLTLERSRAGHRVRPRQELDDDF